MNIVQQFQLRYLLIIQFNLKWFFVFILTSELQNTKSTRKRVSNDLKSLQRHLINTCAFLKIAWIF